MHKILNIDNSKKIKKLSDWPSTSNGETMCPNNMS